MHANNGKTRWSAFLPAMPRPVRSDVLWATLGGFSGIAACALLIPLVERIGGIHLFLVAPLGASAVLVFAVPNSPLAQPWSAVAGNFIAAVCGVAAVSLLEPWLAPTAAVAAAFAAMMLGRALHPPGGAVALLIGLTPELVNETGALFLCLNAGLMTGALVLTGIVFHKFSGRRYPFRTELSGRAVTGPQRLGLTRDELSDLLSRFHQSANLGAVDLARLVAAVEEETVHHRFEGAQCADAVNRHVATIGPDADLSEMVRRFQETDLPVLPVVERDGGLVGLVRQKDVLTQLSRTKNLRLFAPARCARELSYLPDAVLEHDAPLAHAVNLMIRDSLDLVPITERGVFKGLLTRSVLLDIVLLTDRERKAA